MASQPDRSGTVRSLIRGLSMLELVNKVGGIRPSDAARMLSIPRPTSHRILETLEEMGYVCRSPSDNRFFVTVEATRLSAGYNGNARLSRAAGPLLTSLLEEIVWPVNITSYHEGKMVVLETTHARSPFSTDPGMLGRKVPLMRTASGRAYLSFCAESERAAIVERLRASSDEEDARLLTPSAIDRMIAQSRADGFASRLGEPYVPSTSSIAVPILVDSCAQASLSVVWSTAALKPGDAVERFLPCLRTAAAKLAGAFDCPAPLANMPAVAPGSPLTH